MKRFLLFLTACSLVSCGEKNTNKDTVYFAGEIVNPTSEYVVLFKNDVVVDSAKLDDNNRFVFSIPDIDEGLHHFDHSPELQYVYLEKGDSMLVRLNTMAFDESLVFSGSNEEVNNFLIEMYLNYEDEERLVYSFYKLHPEAFSHKIDSLRDQKLEELDNLVIGETLSEEAFAMAKASVDYNSFLYKEKYPFYHKKKTGEEIIHNLDSTFYDYRSALSLNEKDLTYFRPYYDYMKYHFGNLSYMACMKDCGMDVHAMKNSHLHFNGHKLVLIDSLVTETELRDNLFRNVAMDYLLKVHESNSDCDKFISKFEKLCSNEAHVSEIKHLYEGIKSLQPKNEIPDIPVQDIAGNTSSLKEISKNNNVVFYFWTGTQRRHFKNVTKHVKKLEKLHPDHKFVGINLRTTRDQWMHMMAENNVDTLNQYWGKDFEQVQNALIIDGLNKCVITEDTLIVDAFANLYASFDANKKAPAVK